MNYVDPLGDPAVDCPVCLSPMRVKLDEKGNEFFACINSQTCNGSRSIMGNDSSKVKSQNNFPTCPRCQSEMKQRNGPRGPFLGCSQYPRCRGTRSL